MTEIYCLCDPRSGAVRYIGKADDTQARLRSHLRDAQRRDYPLYRWIRRLASEGLIPTAVTLFETDGDWQTLERRCIASARRLGHRLLNVAEGGDEPHCPREVRAQNARASTLSRPPAIMRRYRTLEGALKAAKRDATPEVADSLVLTLRIFKATVALARASGTLQEVEESFAERERFQNMEKRRQPKEVEE